MKIDRWIRAFWAFLLGFGLSIAATMGLASAFDMYVDTRLLLWCCGVAAFLGSVCFTLPLDLVPLGASILALGYLWQENYLLASLEAILNRLTRAYNQAYGWGIFRMSVRTAAEMEPDLVFFLCVLGCITALLITRSVCHKSTSLPGLLISVLTIGPCFVVNDCVPDTGWLYLYLLCFLVLILTGAVRKKDEKQGNRLCLMIAPATALLLLFLFAAIPQNTYNRQEQAAKLSEDFLNSDLVQLFLGHANNGSDPAADGKTVDLTTVGYRMETHIQTLEVTAPFTGTLYLRGRAMDLYDGTTWTDSGNYYVSLTWPGYHLDNVGEVHISTRFAHQMLYIPYYAAITDMRNVTLGIENEKKLTDYSFTSRQLPEGNYLSQLKSDNFNPYSLRQYIDMDGDVHRWAQPLAKKLTADTNTPYEMAQAIASYVRNSATYSTRTRKMPGTKDDFARWFLEDSDTGYCVHFATAATVLLQAAGIPARYVTGYTTPVEAGKPITVYADQAHAWTEYWLPGFGWAILDATPSDGSQPQQATTEETSSQTPSESRPEDQPSEPQSTVSQMGGADDPTQDGQKPVKNGLSLTALLKGLLKILLIVSVPLVVILQWWLRLHLYQKKLTAATSNEKALLYWQRAMQYGQLLKKAPEKELFSLAQKAKFSQHTLTEEELLAFKAHLSLQKAALMEKNILLRLYYRFILALF